MTSRLITWVALMAALTAVGAFIRVPIGPVPFTLQVLFVCMAGDTLGSRAGALSQLIYLFLGVAGLPVFGGGVSGPGVVLMPTFGYLVGFVFAALVIGWIVQRRDRVGYIRLFKANVIGLVLIYVLGVGYLHFNLTHVAGKSLSFWTVLKLGFLPFVVVDLTKAALAAYLSFEIRRRGIGPLPTERAFHSI